VLGAFSCRTDHRNGVCEREREKERKKKAFPGTVSRHDCGNIDLRARLNFVTFKVAKKSAERKREEGGGRKGADGSVPIATGRLHRSFDRAHSRFTTLGTPQRSRAIDISIR